MSLETSPSRSTKLLGSMYGIGNLYACSYVLLILEDWLLVLEV